MISDGSKNEIKTISNKVLDDEIYQNVDSADNAGLEVRVTRIYDGVGVHDGRDLCQWCLDRECSNVTLAEAYEIGAFERHPGCGCIIEYTNEKGETTFQDRAGKWVDKNKYLSNNDRGLDSELEYLYNNPPGQKSIGELRTIYIEDVEGGWISPISGFDNYLRQYGRIENDIIGQTTINGIKIKDQSRHFIQRVIGTSRDPKIFTEEHKIVRRSGVSIDDIKEALFHGKPMPIGIRGQDRSQTFIGKKCKVTINPDTGKLIQCNPR